MDADASSIVSVGTFMRWVLWVSAEFVRGMLGWCILPIGADSLLHR